VRRGLYAEATVDAGRARFAAVLSALPSTAALSHRSAAALLGLPLLGAPATVVDVTVPGLPSRTRHGVVLHGRQLPAEAVTVTESLRTTEPLRTAVDLARVLPYPAAVCAADAALRRSGARPERLLEMLVGDRSPGSARARRVGAFCDPAAESPGESLSRVAIASHGLPAPQLQAWVGSLDEPVGRVDFLWPEHRTVGEFDGRTKYGDADALWAEKLREDRIRAAGFEVVRWTWRDAVGDFGPVADRLRAAFVRAARR